ncbi:MAG: RES family NAD+ phosphorylase [Rhodanobacteraceae bacterium]
MNRLPLAVRVDWRRAWRIVASRFPAVGLFDRVAEPADLEAVFEIEGLTNARIREEIGALRLIPPERRVSGPGTTPIMAAFTHLNPAGSRFSDGSFGVFYAAHERDTAIDETVYHRERFLRESAQGPIDIQMRAYVTKIRGRLHDIRGNWSALHDADSYAASQGMAIRLRRQGSNGIVHDSVRHAGGQCVAVFYPDLVAPCVQAAHYTYRWDGTRVTTILELTQLR